MPANRILLPDKNSFDWLILNLLGHDFYHDYNNIVTRVEAIEEDVLIELDLLIDNYHALKAANDSPANIIAALENEKGQPYSVMHGGGGSDSNENEQEYTEEKKDAVNENNNDDAGDNDDADDHDDENYESGMTLSQEAIKDNVVMVGDADYQDADGKEPEKNLDVSIIKNINYESQVLSLKMQHLLAKTKYCLLQIGKNAEIKGDIPMSSTPNSTVNEEEDDVLQKIIYKTIKVDEYADYLSRNWLPIVEISPIPFLNLGSEGHEEDYVFPTYDAIIQYTKKEILKRIDEIKERAIDKIGFLALAPIFKAIIEISLFWEYRGQPLEGEDAEATKKRINDEGTEVKSSLAEQINEILKIDDVKSQYSRGEGDAILFEKQVINNEYISGYLKEIFRTKVNSTNLQDQIDSAGIWAKGYIDSLISGEDTRPLRQIQTKEEIQKQLNDLIPERLRELQTSGSPAYRTKAKSEKYAAFMALLNDPNRGVPPEISENSTSEQLKTFERFVLKLYHPDKIGNSKKTTNYFYGEDVDKRRGKGSPLQVWLIKMFDPNATLTLGQILPKPNKVIGKAIWNSFGGPKGLRSKLNILSDGKFLKGGGFLREFNDVKKQRSALQNLNDILIRSLLIVILKKTKSMENRGDDTNFPIFPIQPSENTRKIEDYSYNRPKFVPLFAGMTLDANWRKANVIKGASKAGLRGIKQGDRIIYSNIFGLLRTDEPPLKLEERKRIARILFLNVERLVLYYQLVAGASSIVQSSESSTVNKKYLLQALGYIVDTSKQSYPDCLKRGFSTIGFLNAGEDKKAETKARRQGKGGGLNVTFRPMSDANFGTIEAMKEGCIAKRQKYFGWLFDDDIIILEDLEAKREEADNPAEEKKLTKEINKLIGEPPDWFKASTPDEQIQLAYNEIVRKLLPEYILTAGTQRKELYKYLTSDVDFPRPVECENVDCSEEKVIGKETTSPPIRSSYIINNASQIYASLDKVDQDRWHFYNLDGMQVRYAQYCPVSSIADSMPLCSLPTKGNTETQKRLVFNPMNITVTYPAAINDDGINEKYSFILQSSTHEDLPTFNTHFNYSKMGNLLKELSEVYKIFGTSIAKRQSSYQLYAGIADDIKAVYPMTDHISDDKITFAGKKQFKTFINRLAQIMQKAREELFKINYRAEIIVDGETMCDTIESNKSLEGEGPFQAASTYLSILKQTNNILLRDWGAKVDEDVEEVSPSVGLFNIFQKNIRDIMEMTVRKSMGDYSQELATVGKFGATPNDDGNAETKYNTANTHIITDEEVKEVHPISLPYDDTGDSLRLFVANDRPSAYRGIFFITQALDGSFNSKSMGGYYRSKVVSLGKGKGSIDSEIKGKSFIVKAPMVIPSQLPEYYSERYAASNTREPRKNNQNEVMLEGEKNIYGYNKNDYMRWKEQQYKLYDNLVPDGLDGWKVASEAEDDGNDDAAPLNFSGMVMAGNSSNNSNNSSNNSSNNEGGEVENVDSDRVDWTTIKQKRNYKMIGGSRLHTRKYFKRISRNKTQKKQRY